MLPHGWPTNISIYCSLRAQVWRRSRLPTVNTAHFTSSALSRKEYLRVVPQFSSPWGGGRYPGSLRPSFLENDVSKSRFSDRTAKGLRLVIQDRLSALQRILRKPESLESLGLSEEAFEDAWGSFRDFMSRATMIKNKDSQVSLLQSLRQTYTEDGKDNLTLRLKYAFYGHVSSTRFTKSEISHQKQIADLRYPSEWYPLTRKTPRKIIMHVGPTNSGKTHHALKRLEEAESGIYAGPLRLLAHEVYTRLNARGKQCALITGEEKRIPESSQKILMSSCTVEMVPYGHPVEVAVIDEIQMIGNQERGWAWSAALLGVVANEVHLCGEERTVPLIQEIAAAIGDPIEINRYERLNPLKMMNKSLKGKFKSLQKGDCVVSFSVMGIHALRREIEKETGKKVAIVYGSLPPETRAQQARLFNDPDNDYDFLVASDAIGMGLNLSIKRIIFEAASKHNGLEVAPLSISTIKQIAGRAGRFRTAHQTVQEDTISSQNNSLSKTLDEVQEQNVGLVTTLEDFDHPMIRRALESEAEPIKSAGLLPPGPIVERFASYFPPGTPFSYIILRLHELCQVHHRFHLCALKDQLAIADIIQPVKDLTIDDRLIFCMAPASMKDASQVRFLRSLAQAVANQKGGGLLDLPELPLETLEQDPSGDRKYLQQLESLHKNIILYLWLSYRFSGVFKDRRLGLKTKEMVEAAIEQSLAKFSFKKQTRRYIKASRDEHVLKMLQERLKQTNQKTGPGPSTAQQLTQDALMTSEKELHQENADIQELNQEAPEILSVLRDTRLSSANTTNLRSDYDEYTTGLDVSEQSVNGGEGFHKGTNDSSSDMV